MCCSPNVASFETSSRSYWKGFTQVGRNLDVAFVIKNSLSAILAVFEANVRHGQNIIFCGTCSVLTTKNKCEAKSFGGWYSRSGETLKGTKPMTARVKMRHLPPLILSHLKATPTTKLFPSP